jgi:hypothetical protein
VTGGWRKLHKEELHNSYSSPSVIRIIKLKRMRSAGHVARMGRRGIHIGYWWENQKEKDHVGRPRLGGWIILKLNLERSDGMVWVGLIWLRKDQWRALVNTVMSFRVQ